MNTVFSLEDPQISEWLLQGKVGIIPTDTIYGLTAPALNPQAVARLYAIKSREHKPGTVIAANVEQLASLGVNRSDLKAVYHHWPNPVSIVIDASEDAGYLHQDVGSLAVRIPDDEQLLRLLERTGPLLTSSANYPGEAAANTAEQARQIFGSEVDFYVDGGDRSGRPPSTVARYEDGKLIVLRQGAIVVDEQNSEES